MRHGRRVDWEEVGNLVLAILREVGEQDQRFREEARYRGVTVEQLVAAAIVEAIREGVEGEGLNLAG